MHAHIRNVLLDACSDDVALGNLRLKAIMLPLCYFLIYFITLFIYTCLFNTINNIFIKITGTS